MRYKVPMRIHRLRGLIAYSFLIESDSALVIVDAGFVGHGRNVLRLIEEIHRHPEDIRLAVITHGHVDHYGGLAEIQEAASFDVLAHPRHTEVIAQGGSANISPGIQPWARGYAVFANAAVGKITPRPVERVIAAHDGMRTDPWGLPGRILFTPGHSDGDISLLVDSGDAFVGDVVQGRRLPFLAPEMPAMACDTDAVLASWQTLLDAGAHHFWPAHGSPVQAWALRPTLESLERRVRRGEPLR